MQFITTGNRIMTENFTVGLFYTITFTNENYLACSCNGIGDNFVSFLCTEPTMQFILDLSTAETVDTIELYGGGAGTTNYNELNNKPSINGETLVGNLTTTDLHIRAVPPIDTTDNNKVLTASYAGGVTSYSWQPISTGTINYNDLSNKPEINGHVLSGNQISSQLGLATAEQGALADTAVQPAALANYQPLIDSEHKLSPALVATDTTNQFATQSQLDQITINKNNLLIEDVTANFVAKAGYTVTTTSHVYKQGKHIFGVLCVAKNSGNYGINENICRNSVNIPSQAIVNGCYMSGGQWQINGVGYVFMQKGGSAQSGEITITDSAGNSTHCFINLDYVAD